MGWLDEVAPPGLAESWDNVGMQVGDPDARVDRVLTCLTVTPQVVDQAIAGRFNCIVSHHPLLFSPLRRFDWSEPVGAMVKTLALHDIALFSSHTNYDKAPRGLNHHLAEILGLTDLTPLVPESADKLYKLVVYVPPSHLDSVRDALGREGAGHIGRYSHCTFSTPGQGTFVPQEGTNPYIGVQGELTMVDEVRLETIIRHSQWPKIKEAMLDAHPYEEVAYDLLPLKNQLPPDVGLGRVGRPSLPMTWDGFLSKVKRVLKLSTVRVIQGAAREKLSGPRSVAVCGGSGGNLIQKAASKADLYITGDVDYHDALVAQEVGLEVWDCGHFGTEKFAGKWLAQAIASAAEREGESVEVEWAKEVDPFFDNLSGE